MQLGINFETDGIMQTIIAAVAIILGGLIVASDAGAASEPVRLKIIYSSFTGAYTPL